MKNGEKDVFISVHAPRVVCTRIYDVPIGVWVLIYYVPIGVWILNYVPIGVWILILSCALVHGGAATSEYFNLLLFSSWHVLGTLGSAG